MAEAFAAAGAGAAVASSPQPTTPQLTTQNPNSVAQRNQATKRGEEEEEPLGAPLWIDNWSEEEREGG